ncbi:MAG: peptidase M23 [Sulfurimonas sp. RIFOXYD12_FULL_33_39]|uniref:peptidoglycan DD-metalloendopeptidase family protein n=1 Tax=unclassified Sulfurimonas TaxID=2623549 RepID=UPI0008B43501|nr:MULTISPECIES: peptidoglycan DD-metalloendopeptidase family protein [unclassified Sulfurimonas]OHE10438.1 MAG: peptidase M23 [Sulfurimonas sp. RIFOXYD12_FULL_33_39]OHE14897.1 MAG: peptidase M23 [Sulfurimonas sp. RIFOXYD2_FULL_34_21]DAB27397.1 MAG TPA: peptidase M23 [Sulfurimonas sp. UBA10385]
MIRFFIFFLLTTSLFSSQVETSRWIDGETYLSFLERNNLPLKTLYYNLDEDEQQLTEEIISNVHFHMSRDANNEIAQVFIPLNDELQIHIYKNNGEYLFETIPIISETRTEAFTLKIDHSPYLDIIRETGSKKLATLFVSSFKHSLNFKSDLRKGDTLVMIYEQKYRLGRPFSMPTLKVAMIEMKNKKHYIYLNSDDRFYNEDGNEVEGFLLATPVKGARISSQFTKRRFHPILKKYRAHLGIDYAAGRGTPIAAAGSGRITFIGTTRGYGNLTKIQHSDGYLTLYAHQKSFKGSLKNGSVVKKGQIIGYVGNTGLSTGPHLHFGLYKDGQAIDPQRVVQVATKKLKGNERVAFLKLKSNYEQSINLHVNNETKFPRVSIYETECYFYDGEVCVQDKIDSDT